VHPRQPGSAMVMDVEFKNRSTGVVEDRLPSQYAVPRHELMPNTHERMLMQGSTAYRKRTRKPKVNLMENPACVDRQITDAYESMRRNRNPALYRPTKADISKSTKLLDQFEKNLTDSDVNHLKLRVLESSGLHEAALQMSRDIHDGVLTRQPLDDTLAAESIPHFDTYTKGSTITNGEGPTYGQSHKPRIFNPLSTSLTKKSNVPSQAANSPGMTVAQLRDLLKSTSTNGKGGGGGGSSVNSSQKSGGGGGNVRGRRRTGPPSTMSSNDSFADFNYNTEYEPDATSKVIQPNWDHSFSSRASIQQSRGGLPHPGVSMLARDTAMDETFREKLSKSRAAAAGTLLLERDLCVERQRLDREDYALSASGQVRCQDKLDEELSPRREFQRDEIRDIMNHRRMRDKQAASMVAKHEMIETLSRIPQPKPLTFVSSAEQSWNSSYKLTDPGY
jgi:hypothetical protein